MNRKQILYFLFLASLTIVVTYSCKREAEYIVPDSPENPFSNTSGGGVNENVDPNSFVGIHSLIFSKRCALPACHDGSFEPDFRTVESAYSTLVYHPVLKNNATNSFTYRVLPGDTGLSWLHERITTNDSVLGRMPLYDVALTAAELKTVETWILSGAPDIFGVSATVPNYNPAFFGVVAYMNDTTGYRVDTIRDNIVAPMKLPADTIIDIWVGIYDTDAQGGFIPGYGLTYNKYKISSNPYNFGPEPEQPLIVEGPATPFIGPNPFGTGLAPFYHHFKINTGNFVKNRAYYYRVYVKDANHPLPIELPENGSQSYLLTYFSFIVQ